MVKIDIFSLAHNSSPYELNTKKQEQVRGGWGKDNIVEGSGTKSSVINKLSISINHEVISGSNYQMFDFNFVLNDKKIDFDLDFINESFTFSDAKFFINGKEY